MSKQLPPINSKTIPTITPTDPKGEYIAVYVVHDLPKSPDFGRISCVVFYKSPDSINTLTYCNSKTAKLHADPRTNLSSMYKLRKIRRDFSNKEFATVLTIRDSWIARCFMIDIFPREHSLVQQYVQCMITENFFTNAGLRFNRTETPELPALCSEPSEPVSGFAFSSVTPRANQNIGGAA